MRGWLLSGALALAAVPPAWATTYALLVGVSGYPSLAPALRLQGPRNDVALLRDSLVQRGVPAGRMELLADGLSARLPTRANILQGLDALATRARAGDWAIVYLSGHGSQQPRKRLGGWPEPDGRDEIFLPIDAGQWDGRIGSVRNAIVDDEIGAALARLQDAGISVWAIFDTCHAGGLSKDWGPVAPDRRWRGVAPALLGVPEAGPAAATKGWQLSRRFGLSGMPATSAASAAPNHGRLVVFYAAAYDEPAAEEYLGREVHGVFTWHLARALDGGRAGDYLALLQSVLRAYGDERRTISTPGAEGELRQCLPFAAASDKCQLHASVAVKTTISE